MAGPKKIISTDNHSNQANITHSANTIISPSVAQPSPKKVINLTADSGASGHYVKETDKAIVSTIQPSLSPSIVNVPTGDTITSTEEGSLPIPQLSKTATKARIFPALKNLSLLSIGQLCDEDCLALFSKYHLIITKNNEIILQGIRNPSNGLWDVPFTTDIPYTTSYESVNAIINKNQTKKQLATFLHKCMFSPTIRTLMKAIKNGNLITFPGIDEINFLKHLPKSMATTFGHLDQEQQGLQSTKSKIQQILQPNIDEDEQKDFFPTATTKEKTFECLAKIV